MVGPVLPVTAGIVLALDASRSYALSATEPPASVLKMLQASSTASDRALASTLLHARTAYTAYLSRGAHINVCSGGANGNGGQPILTLMSPKFDASRPATIHTHYHGNSATVSEDLADRGRFQKRLTETQVADPQLVWVLPECANPPAAYGTRTPTFECSWENVTSQRLATQTALAASGIRAPFVETVASFHSRGYRALSQACQAEGGAGLQCDRLEMLDCLYKDTGDLVAKWAQTPSGQKCKRAVYLYASNELSKAQNLAAAFSDRYERRNVSGGADAHARTRGIYMHVFVTAGHV